MGAVSFANSFAGAAGSLVGVGTSPSWGRHYLKCLRDRAGERQCWRADGGTDRRHRHSWRREHDYQCLRHRVGHRQHPIPPRQGIGGLIGNLSTFQTAVSLSNAYATGVVSGGATAIVGGLVGMYQKPVRVYDDSERYSAGSVSGARRSAWRPRRPGIHVERWVRSSFKRLLGHYRQRTSASPLGVRHLPRSCRALPSGFQWLDLGHGVRHPLPYLTAFFPNGVEMIHGTAFSASRPRPLGLWSTSMPAGSC